MSLSNDAIFKFYRHAKKIQDGTVSGLYSLENEILVLILKRLNEIGYEYDAEDMFAETVMVVEAYVHGNRYMNVWLYEMDRETLNEIRKKLNAFIDKYNFMMDYNTKIDSKALFRQNLGFLEDSSITIPSDAEMLKMDEYFNGGQNDEISN